MHCLTNRAAFAARLREILGGDTFTTTAAAEQLRMDQISVAAAINGNPTIGLMVAVVRECGVDPTWLLTGDYSSATHRAASEDPVRAVYETVKRLESHTANPGPEVHTAE